MPVRRLPSNPNLDHLRYQARDLLKGHAALDPGVAQRIREFHPGFSGVTDAEIFETRLTLGGAQLAIARESGFSSWARLKAHVEKRALTHPLDLPHHQRIDDAEFRRAVNLLDTGDVPGLYSLLNQYPNLVHRRVSFEGGNYFRNPTLLEFVAENPVRHGTLPPNIVEVARVILDAGAGQSAINAALGLVSTGRVSRECRVQAPLIDLLCDRGADPVGAAQAAASHGEFEAVEALVRRGAPINLPLAAALGHMDDFRRLFPMASGEDRHMALAMGSRFGHVGVVRLLLDAGEDPNRYNPVGCHSHSTPLHQAAFEGHDQLVRLLVQRGARVDLKDVLWQGTAADWARHGGRSEIEAYLRGQEGA